MEYRWVLWNFVKVVIKDYAYKNKFYINPYGVTKLFFRQRISKSLFLDKCY